MYRKELVLKSVIIEAFDTTAELSRENYEIYLSSLVMEPYLDTERLGLIVNMINHSVSEQEE